MVMIIIFINNFDPTIYCNVMTKLQGITKHYIIQTQTCQLVVSVTHETFESQTHKFQTEDFFFSPPNSGWSLAARTISAHLTASCSSINLSLYWFRSISTRAISSRVNLFLCPGGRPSCNGYLVTVVALTASLSSPRLIIIIIVIIIIIITTDHSLPLPTAAIVVAIVVANKFRQMSTSKIIYFIVDGTVIIITIIIIIIIIIIDNITAFIPPRSLSSLPTSSPSPWLLPESLFLSLSNSSLIFLSSSSSSATRAFVLSFDWTAVFNSSLRISFSLKCKTIITAGQ